MLITLIVHSVNIMFSYVAKCSVNPYPANVENRVRS